MLYVVIDIFELLSKTKQMEQDKEGLRRVRLTQTTKQEMTPHGVKGKKECGIIRAETGKEQFWKSRSCMQY